MQCFVAVVVHAVPDPNQETEEHVDDRDSGPQGSSSLRPDKGCELPLMLIIQAFQKSSIEKLDALIGDR